MLLAPEKSSRNHL